MFNFLLALLILSLAYMVYTVLKAKAVDKDDENF